MWCCDTVQADVAHAYWVLYNNGVPRDNMVLMYYDDIANNTLNPHPGTIRNHPQGRDLYNGLPKDYTHEEVNAQNFLGVLRGDASLVTKNSHASGRVLDATEHDRVFVFYSDHGDYLYADQLMAAIRHRYDANGFKEMVLFIEACESGSMFDGLLSSDDLLNVYAMTASNPRESSWGVYCPGMRPAPPTEYTTCLGDLYSVAWMEDVERKGNDLNKESLRRLFERVRTRTNLSHVMEYGELEIEYEPVSWYLGYPGGVTLEDVNTTIENQGEDHAAEELAASAIEQRDADLVHLALTDPAEYAREVDRRHAMDSHVEMTAVRAYESRMLKDQQAIQAGQTGQTGQTIQESGHPWFFPPTSSWDWDCVRSLVSLYETTCGRLSDYGMRHSPIFAGLCALGVDTTHLRHALAFEPC
jgi:legumain